MITPLLRLKEFFKCILLILVMSLFSSHLKAQITLSSLAAGDFINGTQGNYILNGTTGTGPTYFKNSNLYLAVAIDGSNNIAFSQQSTTSISRIDGSRIITFPAATNIGALAVDRENEFIYAASPSSSTSSPGSINRYIWKNTNNANSVGYYVGGAVSAATQTTVATVPFINSTDLVFLNGAASTSPLSIGLNNLCLAFDLTGNLYYADYTYNIVRKISIEKATPGAAASAASTITLSVAPSAAVRVGDLVSGLFIPASTYITAISGSSITLSKPITGAINGTSTLAIITGVSDIVGTGTAGTTLGATAGTTPIQFPYGLTFDPSGNLFLNDQYNVTPRILKISAPISPNSAIATFGTGYGSKVQGIATDVNGNLYVADKTNGKILKISANGGAASVLVGSAGSLNLSAYTTTAGNPVISISTPDLNNLNKLKVGMKIRGTGIPNGATVVAINNTTVPYSITISTPAGVFAAAPYGNAATGSTSLTISSANSIVAGQNVVGAGIPPNTTVVSLSGTTVTLSAQTTAPLVTTQLFFYAPAVFGTQVASTTTNSSSEDGFTTSVGSYGYVENPFGIAVSNDATNPFVVYPEQFQKYVRKISGSSINTSTAAVPTITSFTPTASALAGAPITITGTNFTGATAVSFGGNDAASFTIVSPTSITAVIGTGTTGNIYVTTPGGTAVSGSTLKVIPVVSAFTPTSGASGGVITITGNNFLAATAVKIGGIAVASFTVNDNTTITATAAATATGTIAVTTAAGTGTSTGTFTFVTAPSALTYSTATSTTSYGTAGTSVAPTVSGGVPTYSLTGTVPAGVSIDPSTGVISYSNTLAAGNYPLTVNASNNFPGITTAIYTIIVNAIAPSLLSYSPATATADYGTAGTSAAATINNGGATVTYSIGAPVPAGISIDATTGIISFANTLAVGNYPLTVMGTSTAGSTNNAYSISINAIAPTTLVYSPATTTGNFGTAGTSVAPTINSGGETITYTLTTPPAGVTINSTGVISYPSTLAVGTYPLSVVATNSVGNTGSNYSLTISAIAPTALVYSPATKTGSFGTAGTSVAPTINTGGATVTYSLTGTVPSGITINSTTGVISYANTLSAGNYPLTVNAANSVASTTATYSVTINAVAPSALVYTPAVLTGARASAGTSVSPSINNGGAVVTYSILTGAVAGITINSSTGVISYTNTLAAGSYPLTVKALNSAGNITTAFNITITASSDANLNSLAISNGTLTPVFNSGTTSYTVEVPLAISSVTFTPTTSDSFASVKINGTTVTSGTASAGISLATGPNAINVVVTAQSGTTKTYTVTVTRLVLIPQTISFATLSAVTYGATGQSLAASSTNSTIPLTYTSSNTAVATISTTGVIQTVGVGSTSITVAQSGNSTYQVATPLSQTLNVNPAALTITAKNIGKEYDGVPYSGGNGVTYTGFVLGDDASKLSGSLSYVGTAQGAKNVGSYLISPIGNTATNYVISYQPGSLAITKAALTVTADNKAMCQGNGLPVFTLSYTGFKNGDTENSLNTKPAVSTTAKSTSSAGNYVLSPTAGTSANYTFAYVNGTLTINALTTVGITSSKTSISKGEILVLTASGGNTYQWSNGNGISGSLNSAVLTIRPTQSGSYTVTATNAGGCSQTSSINIEVRDDFEAVKAGNILSPNGDGYNDLWEVKNIDMYPNNEVKVFDKSGRLLYSKRGYDNSWNATLNGNALQEGTYYYIIDFGTGKLKQTGYITIIGQQ